MYIAHAIHLYSWSLWEENPSFMATDVNHAANSSVNYHWEGKQAGAFRKANTFHEKTPRSLTEDDTSTLLPRTLRLSQGKEANRNKKMKVTPLELFYIKNRRREENTLWLGFVYLSDKNNRGFFSLPSLECMKQLCLNHKPTRGPAFLLF